VRLEPPYADETERSKMLSNLRKSHPEFASRDTVILRLDEYEKLVAAGLEALEAADAERKRKAPEEPVPVTDESLRTRNAELEGLLQAMTARMAEQSQQCTIPRDVYVDNGLVCI
jgi:hypothetical protein